jgi:ADP-ribose pyrophosphatase YjhB (NUDIX family)
MAYSEPIEAAEYQELMASHGQPEFEQIRVEVDEELYQNRFMRRSDRRGEVVFAIQLPAGIMVQRKAFYGDGVFRLPGGGIDYGEKVTDALHREIWEETGLRCSGERLLGIQDCELAWGDNSLRFVSYIFYLQAQGEPRLDPKEKIVALRLIPPAELRDIAASLRNTLPPHAGWGRWRALAHDLVYRCLTGRADE